VFSQSVLLREGLYGQRLAELQTGLLLAGWLLGSGLGAALGARLRRPRPGWGLSALLMVPVTALAAVLLRSGSLPSPLCVLPAGLLAGVLFVQPFEVLRPTRAYMLEALGAAAGGVVFLLLSPHLLTPWMLAVGMLLAGVALPAASLPAALAMLVATAATVPLRLPQRFQGLMESGLPGEDAVSSPSPYGEVSVVRRAGQPAVYLGGVLVGSAGTPETSENTAVVPLLLSDPAHVVYVGYSTGTARLLASWPGVEQVHMVVLTGRALVGGEEGLPENVDLVEGDGRAWLSGMEGTADLVIIDGGLPLSLATNRFYTSEMMGLAARKLSPGGMLSLGFHVGENRMLPADARLVSSIMAAGKDRFSAVRVLPLGGALFLFSSRDSLRVRGSRLAGLLEDRGAETVWLTPGTLEFELSDWRLESFAGQLAGTDADANRDLRPVAVELAGELWRTRMGGEPGMGAAPWAVLGVCVLLLGASLIRRGRRRLCLSLASIGLGEISAETAVILVIQSTLGYSYSLVGLVSAAAMGGLAAGAWLSGRGRLSGLVTVHGTALGAVVLLAAFCGLYDAGVITTAPLAVLCLGALLILGCAAGAQFPLAVGEAGGGRRNVGLLEMADLSGSAAGGVLLPLLLFPLLGATLSLLVVAGLMAVPGASLAAGRS
jgi:spermidine synthase